MNLQKAIKLVEQEIDYYERLIQEAPGNLLVLEDSQLKIKAIQLLISHAQSSERTHKEVSVEDLKKTIDKWYDEHYEEKLIKGTIENAMYEDLVRDLHKLGMRKE